MGKNSIHYSLHSLAGPIHRAAAAAGPPRALSREKAPSLRSPCIFFFSLASSISYIVGKLLPNLVGRCDQPTNRPGPGKRVKSNDTRLHTPTKSLLRSPAESTVRAVDYPRTPQKRLFVVLFQGGPRADAAGSRAVQHPPRGSQPPDFSVYVFLQALQNYMFTFSHPQTSEPKYYMER